MPGPWEDFASQKQPGPWTQFPKTDTLAKGAAKNQLDMSSLPSPTMSPQGFGPTPGRMGQPGEAEMKPTDSTGVGYFQRLQSDLQYGGESTGLGKLAHTVMPGLYRGVSPGAADVVGGVPLGLSKVGEALSEPRVTTHAINKLVEGGMQAVAVPAMALAPGGSALPSLAKFTAIQKTAQYAAKQMGMSDEGAELFGNVAGAVHTGPRVADDIKAGRSGDTGQSAITPPAPREAATEVPRPEAPLAKSEFWVGPNEKPTPLSPEARAEFDAKFKVQRDSNLAAQSLGINPRSVDEALKSKAPEVGEPKQASPEAKSLEPGETPKQATGSGEPVQSSEGPTLAAHTPFSLAREGAKRLEDYYNKNIADPLINKYLKIGRTHMDIEEIDPGMADAFRRNDNGYKFYQGNAKSIIKNVVGDLNPDQERLFTLMADSDSRENLRDKHPAEYIQAMKDPEVQAALKRYEPHAQALKNDQLALGGQVIDDGYLRRVYAAHTAGMRRETIGDQTADFDRVIRPRSADGLQRKMDAEYFYKNGLHEFGPAFGTKYVATRMKMDGNMLTMRLKIDATKVDVGDYTPTQINYKGQDYYSREIAQQLRESGQKNVKEYGIYSEGPRVYPTALGEKAIASNPKRFLAPKEITDYMNHHDQMVSGDAPNSIRRFLQEQVVGLGFGIPHIENILRRVAQSAPMGVANPLGWARGFKVLFSNELKARGLSGMEDPTFNQLARYGAISTESQISNFKKYIGGNVNPANWIKPFAKIGHDFLFKPGGLDNRARLYIADLVKSQHPEYGDSRIAQAVNEQLGNYNKTNWTGMQKQLGKYMLFPGWDMSSAAWVVRHPIRTSVPPALLILAANQAINSMGGNSESNKNDLFAIHYGDRSYSPSIAEPLAKSAMGWAMRGTSSLLHGNSPQRAASDAASGLLRDAARPLGMLSPVITAPFELATNRDRIGSDQAIYDKNKDIYPTPTPMLKKLAFHALAKAVPQIGRIAEAVKNGKVDVPQMIGSEVGVYNYQTDIRASLAAKLKTSRLFMKQQKDAQAPADIKAALDADPDAALSTLYHDDITYQLGKLKEIDQMRDKVDHSLATKVRKDAQYAALDKMQSAQEAQAKRLDAALELILKRAHAHDSHLVSSEPGSL